MRTIQKSGTQAEASADRSPHWYASSEWWLVFIAALTGFAIAYQAREMTKATNVMEKQSRLLEHQINKERAYVRIEIKSFEPKYPDTGEDSALQEIEFSVKFFGATDAFVDSVNFSAMRKESTDFVSSSQWDEWGIIDIPDIVPPGSPTIEGVIPFLTTRFEVDSLFHGKSFIAA